MLKLVEQYWVAVVAVVVVVVVVDMCDLLAADMLFGIVLMLEMLRQCVHN